LKNLYLAALTLISSYGLHAQTFTGGTGPILDFQTIDVPATVVVPQTSINTTTFGLETVCINLTHTYLADLTIELVAPDGTVKLLAGGIGGGDDDLVNTCFNTFAAANIATGAAPYTGTYTPMGQMGAVNNGQNPNGTWYLRVTDGYGADEGAVQDWSLTFGSNPADYFQFVESDLPIVVINTGGQTIQADNKVNVDMGIIYNGPGNRNHMIDPFNEYNGKIGLEYRGNYSLSLPQKPYAFELRDTLGNDIDSSLIGMPAESDWNLMANYNDKSFARNFVPFNLFDSMGHYGVRSRFVDVVIDGDYQGVYMLCEKIKRDSNRIDISKLDSTEILGLDATGGYIIKVDYHDATNSWLSDYSPIGFPGLDIHYVYYYPKPSDIVPAQKTYIQNYINQLETALYSVGYDDPTFGYRRFMHIESFIDYFIINELTRNVDGFKKSRFFWKDKDYSDGTYKKLHAGPVWDFDWSQKDMWSGSEDGSQFMYGEVDQDVNACGWYIRLLQDTVFANEVRCRYDDLRRNILSLPYILAKIDSVANVVNESQAWHYQTWGNMGVATGTGEVQPPAQSYAEEVQRLKDWYTRRIAWLDINMPGTLNGCSMAVVDELAFSKAEVYPNPFSGSIIVELGEMLTEETTVTLLDAQGRSIKTLVAAQQSNFVQFNQLEAIGSGMYFLKITDGKRSRLMKVSKV
jgi:subtilisin-like proprotein convertase family protein